MIQLGRSIYSPTQGTVGWMDIDGWRCCTIEEIWKENRRNVSCIPVGTYPLRPAIHHISTPDPNDDYPVYEICDVPDRSAIHIHVAQTIRDLQGCVGVGTRHGTLHDHWAVMESRKAFGEMMERMDKAYKEADGDLRISIGNVVSEGGTL